MTTFSSDSSFIPYMTYIKQNADWLSGLFFVVLFVLFPSLDIVVSEWFYDADNQQWSYRHHPINASIYALFRYLPHVLIPLMLIIIGLTFVKQGIRASDRKPWLFLLLTLLIGPGLIIHEGFKKGFDRPRPKQVEIFNGDYQFISAFSVSQDCDKKCKSFVSGHAAMGFFFMAFAWIFRRRSWLWWGIFIGVISSAVRITQGGHFISDCIFAGYVCYFTARLMSYWLLGHSRILSGSNE